MVGRPEETLEFSRKFSFLSDRWEPFVSTKASLSQTIQMRLPDQWTAASETERLSMVVEEWWNRPQLSHPSQPQSKNGLEAHFAMGSPLESTERTGSVSEEWEHGEIASPLTASSGSPETSATTQDAIMDPSPPAESGDEIPAAAAFQRMQHPVPITDASSTGNSIGSTASDREQNDSGPRPNKRRRVDIDTADGDPGLDVFHAGSFNDNDIDNPISNEPSASDHVLHTTTHTSFTNPGPFGEHSLSAQPIQGCHGEQLHDHSTESSASGPGDTLLGTIGGGRNESSPTWDSMFTDVDMLWFEEESWNHETTDWGRMFKQAEEVSFEDGLIENISGWP